MGFNPLACKYGNFVIPQRYVLCFMVFMGIVNSYSQRVCLNIALTEMVSLPKKNVTSKPGADVCEGSSSSVVVEGGTYNWTEKEQGVVLSAFFPGYVITHIPGGLVSDMFGGKHVIGLGLLVSSLLTGLTPLAVRVGGVYLLAVMRFVIGATQGSLFPATNTLLAKWVPKRQRSYLGALVLTGPQIGSITGNLISAFLMGFIGNWPVVFYVWGLLGLIWYAFFIFLCFSTPETHPFITPEEKEMLDTEIGPSQKFKVPWMKIFFDKPCIAQAFGQIGHGAVFFYFVTDLPKYMKDVLKFNIKENGVLNAAPYLALWVSAAISGYICDKLIANETCSILFIRQLYTTIASVGPSVCLLIAGYVGCNRIAAASMFILGLFFMGPFYPGLRVNGLDVTKNFAGLLSAYVNGAGALFFMPIPYIIGAIAKDHTLQESRKVFWIIFAIASVTNVIYVVWASGDRAEWDIAAVPL